MEKKELKLALWKSLHGMVIPMAFFKDIPETDMDAFKEIYDNPEKNLQLAECYFEKSSLFEKVRKETMLCILEYASRSLFEELGVLAVTLYCEADDNSNVDAMPLLKILSERNYSYVVHCAFCLMAFNFEQISESCLPMLEKVYEQHKAGLEARGKKWFEKRHSY